MKTSRIKWAISALLFGLLIACTLEEPILPTWLAEWVIPFSDSYTIEEALDDPHFISDTTGSGERRIAISFSDSSEKKTVSISDLAIKPDDDYASQAIQDLTLGTIGPIASSTITLEDMLGVTPVEGMPVSIPDTTVQVDVVYLLYIDVGWAKIKSGEFRLEFVNNTFLDIRSGMQVFIFDDSTDVQIGAMDFTDPIPSMSSVVATPDLDLSGSEIHSRFLLQLQIPLAATSRILGVDDLDDIAWINGTLIDIMVEEAEAVFPPQYSLFRDSSSVVDQEHRVRTAEIAQGGIDLEIENRLAVISHVSVKLLNFTQINTGETLFESFELQPHSMTNTRIVVEDYLIADYPNPASGNLIDYLQYEVEVTTDSSQEFVTISERDSVTVTVQPDSLFFRKIDGQVHNVEIDLDPVVEDDLGDMDKIDGEIYMDSLEMRLDLFNETGLPIDITAVISGTNGTDEVTLDPIHIEVPSAGEGGYIQVKLSANDPSPNIIDLMGILPTSIRLDAQAFIDGDGSVETGQNVWAEYEVFSPLFLRIERPSTMTSDIQSDEIDESTRKRIQDNLKNDSVMEIEFLNGFPVAAIASIYVSNDSTNLFDETVTDPSAKLIISDLEVGAGQLGSDGFVEQPTIDKLMITITEEQRSIFYLNEVIYIGTKATLDQTDGLVKFHPEDEIRINGAFRFQYLMNNED